MITSQKGIDLIKEFEGFEPVTYTDAVGVKTIGYGTALFTPEVIARYDGRTISVSEAEQLLQLHLSNNVEPFIRSLVTVEINQNQFDALSSFIYNVGAGNFRNSTLLKVINRGGTKEEIKAQFERWNKGRVNGELVELKGLTRRRNKESDLYFAMDSKKKVLIFVIVALTTFAIYLLYRNLK